MTLVEDYWAGVARRLQAEVSGMNQLVWHQGEKGRENEQSLSRVVERLVPTRFGVGTGLLFDSHGNRSSQMDIVVFDSADEPALLAQTTQTLYPVENVRACIEVKSTIDSREITDVGKKCRSVTHGLRPQAGNLPFFAAMAYRSSIGPETIARHLIDLGEDCPNVLCVLEMGLIAFRASTDEGGARPLVVGITPARAQGSGGVSVGEYITVSRDHSEAEIMHDGQAHPVVKMGGDRYVIEPARSLLLFCEALISGLVSADGRTPTLSLYVTDATRDLCHVTVP